MPSEHEYKDCLRFLTSEQRAVALYLEGLIKATRLKIPVVSPPVKVDLQPITERLDLLEQKMNRKLKEVKDFDTEMGGLKRELAACKTQLNDAVKKYDTDISASVKVIDSKSTEIRTLINDAKKLGLVKEGVTK